MDAISEQMRPSRQALQLAVHGRYQRADAAVETGLAVAHCLQAPDGASGEVIGEGVSMEINDPGHWVRSRSETHVIPPEQQGRAQRGLRRYGRELSWGAPAVGRLYRLLDFQHRGFVV